ncbi:MAG: hypothetical protein CML51_05400 [Rhodobacteraceae bacterium]|nr:hypothetical protein [Paracoccaceae bacterium]
MRVDGAAILKQQIHTTQGFPDPAIFTFNATKTAQPRRGIRNMADDFPIAVILRAELQSATSLRQFQPTSGGAELPFGG